MKIARYFCSILTEFLNSRQIFVKSKLSNLTVILSVGAALICADGHDEFNRRFTWLSICA